MIYSRAFVIIELLIAITIFLTTFLICAPLLGVFVGNTRKVVYTNELANALQFARNSAVELCEPTVFCGSRTHLACDGEWQDGQIVITAVTKKILRVFSPLATGESLVWRGSFGVNDNIIFLPDGFVHGLQGSFCYYDRAGGSCEVVLNAAGRVRVNIKGYNNC